MQSFTPSKLVWTEADFEEMSWHDCRLHGIGLIDDFDPHSHELCLDVNYILQWRRAAAGDECDGFWISPATLVFTPESFHIHFAGLSGSWIISIDRGAMISDCYEWLVRLNTGGSITISAPGYRQYLRRAPVFIAAPDQSLETSQRGAISFDTSTYHA